MTAVLSDQQMAAVMHPKSSRGFEPIALVAGPRALPDWVSGAAINWMEGFGNAPELWVRCRRDPLKASNTAKLYRFTPPDAYIAEQDGVASVHYHSGRVTIQKFTRFLRWTSGAWNNDLPSLLDGEHDFERDFYGNLSTPKMGGAEHEIYTMLATTQQQGYAGRGFNVMMHPDDPHFGGQEIMLRGPWHGGAPDGFVEVNYFIPDPARDAFWTKRGNPWWKRGGYFGLYVRAELLLDIMATFVPHVGWCWEEASVGRRLRPLRPETGLPKGVYVAPGDCPGHRYGLGSATTQHPYDQCVFCEQRRNPDWQLGKAK